MKKAATLLATCAIVLSASSFGTPTQNCNQGCTVTVSISGACGANGENVKVSLDPIAIEVQPGRRATIKWQMAAGSPWSFSTAPNAKGIEFVNFSSAAFENLPALAAKEVTVTNTPTRRGTYKYDINLTRQVGGSTETCRKDPTVVNW
jgi:hypothetical protein